MPIFGFDKYISIISKKYKLSKYKDIYIYCYFQNNDLKKQN